MRNGIGIFPSSSRKSAFASLTGPSLGETGMDALRKSIQTLPRFHPVALEIIHRRGSPAVTTFRKLDSADGYSWIQALPKTGRTHQLRLHCLEAGYPIVGDRFYAKDFSNPLLLHARSLAFELPEGSRKLSLSAEPPVCWKPWLEKFETRKKS